MCLKSLWDSNKAVLRLYVPESSFGADVCKNPLLTLIVEHD